MTTDSLPLLVTFDGEARSGKGTVVQATKDYLRDVCGYKVMLIDSGQVFRVLVVAIARAGIDIEDPAAIDVFLRNEDELKHCAELVHDVYHMPKDEREALLYTAQVNEDAAKVGARPLAQEFKDKLLRRWLHKAADEGYQVVLHDGRALQELGSLFESEGLCRYILGFYFICDPKMSARRTLGYAATPYDELPDTRRAEVDETAAHITVRNDRDATREVHPLVRPTDATVVTLPEVPPLANGGQRIMAVMDTSAEMTKEEMTVPVQELVGRIVAIEKN